MTANIAIAQLMLSALLVSVTFIWGSSDTAAPTTTGGIGTRNCRHTFSGV